MERWNQETQCRYLKKFQKVTGGYEGCMVVVTNDGKCRTYFLPSVSKLDQSRKGISYEVIKKDVSSTGHDATQTTETIAVSGRSGDRDNKISPVSEKVKGDYSRNPEEIQKKCKKRQSRVCNQVGVSRHQTSYLVPCTSYLVPRTSIL